MGSIKTLLAVGVICSLVGCQTIDVVQHPARDLGDMREGAVDYWVSPSFDPESLECIAIFPTKAGDTFVKEGELSQTHSILVSQLAPFNYRDLIVKGDINVDDSAYCEGEVRSTLKEVEGTNIAIYSEKKRALAIELTINGELQWQVQHRFVARAGSLPTNPLSLIVGIYQAQINTSEESIYVHNTKLIRRMVATLPDRSELTLLPGEGAVIASSVDIDLLLDAGRYEEVIDTIGQSQQLSIKELWSLGRAYLGLDQNQLALDQFMTQLLYEPDSPKAWLGVGLAKERLGEISHAYAAYDKALALYEPSFVGHFQLGVLLQQIEHPGSVDHFKRAGILATQSDNLALASRALFAMNSLQPMSLSNEELRSVY